MLLSEVIILYSMHTYKHVQVHLSSRFIMNGVCVKWVGWVDLETLTGKAKLVFDDQNAKVCVVLILVTVMVG